MKLSCVVIAKNEEVMIETMIKSIQGVDEIIICDTGSTDKTVEIANKYAKVVHFEWCDDFSKARNYAKSHATGDWIISIDCDEVLEEGAIEKIRYAIENTPKCDGLLITLYNEQAGSTSAFRVFKKKLDWIGAIHEIVHPKKPAKLTEVKITFGISPAHNLDPHLDLRILQTEFERDPENARTVYYLARELINYGDHESGAKLMGHYIKMSKSIDEQTDAYYQLALCFVMLGRREEAAVSAIQAVVRNPNFKAAIQLIADVQPVVEWKQRWETFAEGANNEGLIYIHDFHKECRR